MTAVISVVNLKGGVAKTTSVYNIAACLVERGCRVLMVDNDGQASLTLSCGIDPRKLEHSTIDIYLRQAKIKECIIPTQIENLDIVPANIKLSSQETKIFNEIQRESILKRALEDIYGAYDFVIIDNPPAFGITSINSLMSSDYLIVTCEASPMSTYALDDMDKTIEDMKDFNPGLNILGVLVTKYNKVAKVQQDEMAYLEANYNIIGVIKRSTEAEKPLEKGIPAVIYDKNTDVAKQYEKATDTILAMIYGTGEEG